MEYRRGVGSDKGSTLWHFHWDCQFYPNTAYVIRKDRPPDEDLCARCQNRADAKGIASGLP